MRVRDLMTGGVATIGQADSCHEAVNRMVRRKIRHLPVVDEDGRLVGVVTDRDLRHHLFAPQVLRGIGAVTVDALFRAVPVKEVMSAPVVTAAPDEDLEVAAGAMLEGKVGSLPVVEAGRVVGIITETDLLRQICGSQPASPECAEIVVSFP
jgi:acetoin utilization protein AcuB